jgi:hypothetical protein
MRKTTATKMLIPISMNKALKIFVLTGSKIEGHWFWGDEHHQDSV